jgi:hypothetical protein
VRVYFGVVGEELRYPLGLMAARSVLKSNAPRLSLGARPPVR